jgi:hypothetical protein
MDELIIVVFLMGSRKQVCRYYRRTKEIPKMSFLSEMKYKATIMSCTSFQAQISHENNKLPRPDGDGHESCTTRIWGYPLGKGPT